MRLATSPIFCSIAHQDMRKCCVWGGWTHKSIFFYYPVTLLDQVGSVIQRVRFREEPLFDDRHQFIERFNPILQEHLRDARYEEMEVFAEHLKRLEQIVDGAVFPEKCMTGCIEHQRDDKIPQSGVQPFVLVRPFLEVLIGEGDKFVDDRLHVCRGEKLVARRKQRFLRQRSAFEPEGMRFSCQGNKEYQENYELFTHSEGYRSHAYSREIIFLG